MQLPAPVQYSALWHPRIHFEVILQTCYPERLRDWHTDGWVRAWGKLHGQEFFLITVMLTLALLKIPTRSQPQCWQNSSIWTLKPIYPLTVTGIYADSGSIICLSRDGWFWFLCTISCLVFPEKSTRKAIGCYKLALEGRIAQGSERRDMLPP